VPRDSQPNRSRLIGTFATSLRRNFCPDGLYFASLSRAPRPQGTCFIRADQVLSSILLPLSHRPRFCLLRLLYKTSGHPPKNLYQEILRRCAVFLRSLRAVKARSTSARLRRMLPPPTRSVRCRARYRRTQRARQRALSSSFRLRHTAFDGGCRIGRALEPTAIRGSVGWGLGIAHARSARPDVLGSMRVGSAGAKKYRRVSANV